MSLVHIKALANALNTRADRINKICPQADIKFWVGKHFIDRLKMRYNGNLDAAMLLVVETIFDNICTVIYYRHLDTILPDRGRIKVDETYEIRGNIVDNRYVLSTFINKDMDE